MDETTENPVDQMLPDYLKQVSERRQDRTALGPSTTYLCHDSRTAMQAIISIYEQVNRRDAVAVLTLQKKLSDEIGRNCFRFHLAYDGGLLDDGFWLLHRIETKQTLVEWWEQDQSVNDRVTVFLELAVGLNILHKASVFHGRLCPECIYVDSSGESLRCIIGDTLTVRNKWGFSIQGQNSRNYLRYAVPETVKPAEFDEAADNYSLGMIVSLLLTLKSNLLPTDHTILADHSVKLIDIHTSGKNGIRDFIQMLLKMLGGKPFKEEVLAYETFWSSEFDTKPLTIQPQSTTYRNQASRTNSYPLLESDEPSNAPKPLPYVVSVIALLAICMVPLMCRPKEQNSTIVSGVSNRKPTRQVPPTALVDSGKKVMETNIPLPNKVKRKDASTGFPPPQNVFSPGIYGRLSAPTRGRTPLSPPNGVVPLQPTRQYQPGVQPRGRINSPAVFDEDHRSTNAIMDK